MANDIENGEEIDRDDDDLVDFPREKLMEMLSAGDNDDDDEKTAFGAGDVEDPKEAATVSVDDGLDLIDKASKTRRADAEVPAEVPGADKAPQAEDTPADPAAQTEIPADAPDADLDAMLEGLDEGKRTAIQGRVKAADDVMGLFKGREKDLEALGVKPQDAVKQLLDINSYARRNPSEYLAWAAGQFGDGAEVLGKAAERLGMKLVKADAEDQGEEDPFEDEEKKAMRAELAQLKAAQNPQAQIGPDAPQNRAQADIEAFSAARPDFKELSTHIAAMASSHHQTTGQPVTIADLDRFYKAAKAAFGAPGSAPTDSAPTSAAQAPAPVQQVDPKAAADAARLARAKAASKSLDGSGQGAGRRPALDPDASIEASLMYFGKGAFDS